jgi:hypothetical protein
MHVESDAWEGVFQAALNQADGEVRHVYADPLPAKLLRGVNRGAATAEWIKHNVAGIA